VLLFLTQHFCRIIYIKAAFRSDLPWIGFIDLSIFFIYLNFSHNFPSLGSTFSELNSKDAFPFIFLFAPKNEAKKGIFARRMELRLSRSV